MGPALEFKVKSEASPEILVDKEDIPEKVFQFGTNYKGDDAYEKEALLPIEQTPLSSGNEDVEVNITGYSNSSKALMVEDTCDDDATECSSSFGDTISGRENGSALSDDEVVSNMESSNPFSSLFDQWCEPSLLRKKKLTSHWKRFIRPLSWRCKWIELKLKQLQSQALEYEKELAAYDCRKQQEFANFTLDNGFSAKSVPLSSQICRRKVVNRKKRKRVEDTCDLASYMSNHSAFSYYEKKEHAGNARLNDVSGVAFAGNAHNKEDIKLNDILSSLDYKDNDKSLETIILKIEAVQSQVHGLKTRIDKVVTENLGKLCTANNLNILGPSDDMNLFDLSSSSLASEFQKAMESIEERKPTSEVQVSEQPGLVIKNAVVPNVQSTLKACSASKSKAPRSTRRASVPRNSGAKSRSWR